MQRNQLASDLEIQAQIKVDEALRDQRDRHADALERVSLRARGGGGGGGGGGSGGGGSGGSGSDMPYSSALSGEIGARSSIKNRGRCGGRSPSCAKERTTQGLTFAGAGCGGEGGRDAAASFRAGPRARAAACPGAPGARQPRHPPGRDTDFVCAWGWWGVMRG